MGNSRGTRGIYFISKPRGRSNLNFQNFQFKSFFRWNFKFKVKLKKKKKKKEKNCIKRRVTKSILRWLFPVKYPRQSERNNPRNEAPVRTS